MTIITVHLDHEEIVAAMTADFTDSLSAADVEAAVGAIEEQVRTVHPEVMLLLIKPQGAAALERACARRRAAVGRQGGAARPAFAARPRSKRYSRRRMFPYATRTRQSSPFVAIALSKSVHRPPNRGNSRRLGPPQKLAVRRLNLSDSGAEAISLALASDRGLRHAQLARGLGLRAAALEGLPENFGLDLPKRLSQIAIRRLQ